MSTKINYINSDDDSDEYLTISNLKSQLTLEQWLFWELFGRKQLEYIINKKKRK